MNLLFKCVIEILEMFNVPFYQLLIARYISAGFCYTNAFTHCEVLTIENVFCKYLQKFGIDLIICYLLLNINI